MANYVRVEIPRRMSFARMRMSISMISFSLRCARSFLRVVLLILLLMNIVCVSLAKSVAPVFSMSASKTSSGLSIPLRSDVNGDGVVDILDISTVATAYGSYPGHPKWNPGADLNNDDVVNLIDVVLVAKDFGKKWISYDFDEPLNWSVISGTWSITNGLLEGSSNAEGLICAADAAWKDCMLTAKVKIASDSLRPEVAFCVCFIDSGDFYWAGLGCWGHRVSISRMVDHVPEELVFEGDMIDIIKDVLYKVSIEVSGDTISLYVNDLLELVTKDSAFNNGLVGVRSWNSHILVDCMTVSGFASSHASKSKKLYVDRTLIRDSWGNKIRLQGFNARVGYIDEEGMQWMKSRGFNSIRIGFRWQDVEPIEGTYDETYLSGLDELLNWCEKYQIYALLDFHQWQWSQYFTYYGTGSGFPSWLVSEGGYANSAAGLRQCATDFFMNQGYGKTMREKYINFWKFLVYRYRDNLHVWAYEPINEPLIAKDIVPYSAEVHEAVMSLYEEFTAAIRQIDHDTIIIYHCIDYGTDTVARKVDVDNIGWTRSWYDVAYDGYYPPSEYSELRRRLLQIKTTYNDRCGTPFVVSEMSFDIDTANAEQWIRDSFDTMRNIGLNSGFESWNWWIYTKGPMWDTFQYPRNSDGSDRWIISILQEYLGSD